MHPYADYKDPYGPDNDFFRKWYKDDQGRDCLVGLNYEESKDFGQLQLDWLADRTVPRWRQRDQDDRQRDAERMDDYQSRHELARQQRLADPKDREVRFAEFLARERQS